MTSRYTDPQNPVVTDYVAPSVEELAARKKRNWSIAAGLLTFIVLVFFVTMYQFSNM